MIGPYKTYSTKPGENVAVVDLYCDRGCILRDGTRNGEPVELERYSTDGFPYFEDYVRTPSGDTATIEVDLLLTDAWVGSNTGGAYRLTFVGQSTIRPARVRIVIQAPEGMRIHVMERRLVPPGQIARVRRDACGEPRPADDVRSVAPGASVAFTDRQGHVKRSAVMLRDVGHERTGPVRSLFVGDRV